MANDTLKVAEKLLQEETNSEFLIDPIYQKFVRGITRAIGSTEFYQYFMDAVAGADNEFQFSNRKVVKTVDTVWVDAIESALGAFQAIVSNPRNIIKEEELIVNVANAKKAGSETVRHLAQHAALVEDFNEDSGDVRPSKLMQRYREDSITQYENRLVFTTMEIAHRFVQIRYDALMEQMGDEFGAKLKVQSEMESATEHIHLDMYMHIKEIDSALTTDRKHNDVFNRISRANRVLAMLMNTEFARQLAKLPRVKGTINKTNVLKRNKNYHQIMLLLEFLKSYSDVGYSIDIVEQAPVITEQFEQDIYRNILFNYLILKGYLEDEADRTVSVAYHEQKKTLHPKIVKQIIEELTEDYDLTEVEIRKVLIEELTREQLMEEEAAERLRLVEEREANMTEEERIAEHQRKLEEELQHQKDERYRELYIPELEYFREHLKDRLKERARRQEADGFDKPKEDFADAAQRLEEAERQKQEAQIEALRQKEMALYKPYLEEIYYFLSHMEVYKEQRVQEEEEQRHAYELRQLARRERQQELQQAQKQSIVGSLLKRRRG